MRLTAVSWLLAFLMGISATPTCDVRLSQFAASPARNGPIAYSTYHYLHTVEPDGTDRRTFRRGPRNVSTVSWSPDGSRLVFVCHGGYTADRPAQEICTSDPDGSHLRRLTVNSVAEDEPSWSPDGRYILFRRLIGEDRDPDSSELYRMCSDGSYPKRLTYSQGMEGEPIFSPDGRRILFSAYSLDDDAGLFSMSFDGEDRRVELDEPFRDEESGRWSPDGRSVVFEVGWKIYVRDMATGRERRIAWGIAPAWSPDGNWIVYGSFDDSNQQSSLRKVNVHTGEVVVILRRNAFVPSWGPRRSSPGA